MPRPGSAGKARAYSIFGIIVFALIMVPSAVLVGYITYLLSNLLMILGNGTYALISLVHIISAFNMIFLLPVMFNVLFFARDIAFISAMPVKPIQLFTAKFWHTFKAENFMTATVLLSMFIGWFCASVENYGVAATFDPVTIISALIAMFAIPALPIIYCSVICILLMVILRKARRMSIFYHSSTILFILFAFVFLMSFRGQGGANVEKYVDMLVAGTNSFNDLCDVLFCTTPLFARAMGEHSILYLMAGIAVTVLAYLIMHLIASFLYRKGLFTAGTLGAGKRVKQSVPFRATRDSQFTAVLRKECRILMRTMSYRTNCVYANLIWPILAVVFFALSTSNVNILRFTALYRGGQPHARMMIILCVLAVSFIASGLNSIASTSFTREGAHIDVIHYLPVPISTVTFAKASAAVIFTYIPLSLSVIAASVSLGAGIGLTLLYLLMSFLSVITATFTGVIMDSISPYTVWSDEATALRGNMNCFFNLAFGMLIAAVICGLTYLIYLWQGSGVLCSVITVVILLISSAASVAISLKFVRKM